MVVPLILISLNSSKRTSVTALPLLAEVLRGTLVVAKPMPAYVQVQVKVLVKELQTSTLACPPTVPSIVSEQYAKTVTLPIRTLRPVAAMLLLAKDSTSAPGFL